MIFTICSKTVPRCQRDNSRGSSSSLLLQKVKYLGFFSPNVCHKFGFKTGSSKARNPVKVDLYGSHLCECGRSKGGITFKLEKKQEEKRDHLCSSLRASAEQGLGWNPQPNLPILRLVQQGAAENERVFSKEDRGASNRVSLLTLQERTSTAAARLPKRKMIRRSDFKKSD